MDTSTPICKGFKAAGFTAGLKKNSKTDLGLIYSEVPAAIAGVFTTNRVKAPCVLLNRERVKMGSAQAIIANSGNANCCTGEQGMKDTQKVAAAAASGLGIPDNLVLVASTGVIGEPLPTHKIESALPGLIRSLSPNGFIDFATAIMTTDTFQKVVTQKGDIDGKTYTLTAVAKGAGMIHPNMATMLCFICSDISADPAVLGRILSAAADRTFNKITIDGDTSTNDMAIIMANGLSGAALRTPAHEAAFQETLNEVMLKLAKMIVKDGEGATKLVEIRVTGATGEREAHAVADTIANSNLVKTAFFGEDANWGRIIAAAGRANIPIEPDRIDIFFDNVQMVKNGVGCGKGVEAEATAVLKKPEFTVKVGLNMGSGSASVFTCDFSVDYVKINADYRS